jgi:hypothetical protein
MLLNIVRVVICAAQVKLIKTNLLYFIFKKLKMISFIFFLKIKLDFN